MCVAIDADLRRERGCGDWTITSTVQILHLPVHELIMVLETVKNGSWPTFHIRDKIV